MHKDTLIEDLLAAVKTAEQSAKVLASENHLSLQKNASETCAEIPTELDADTSMAK